MSIVRVRDIVMNYELKGRGQPVILLSGMGADLTMWSTQVPHLASSFLVVTYDHRGSGKTDAPDAAYSIGGMADDCCGLMDQLGVDRAHLVGVSLGGMVAQAMAARSPSRVSSLVLGATGARLSPRHANLLSGMIRAAKEGRSREDIAREEMPWVLPERYLRDDRVAEAVAKARSRRAGAQPLHAMVRQAEAMLGYDGRGLLPLIKCPTMVIAGSKDLLVPAESAAELSGGIEGSELRTIEAAHEMVADDAMGFGQLVMGFLSSTLHGERPESFSRM